MEIPWFARKFENSIRVGDEVWFPDLDCVMCITSIRVDSLGKPLFDLESMFTKETRVARFEEILEMFR